MSNHDARWIWHLFNSTQSPVSDGGRLGRGASVTYKYVYNEFVKQTNLCTYNGCAQKKNVTERIFLLT
jgi:hypothetical protein